MTIRVSPMLLGLGLVACPSGDLSDATTDGDSTTTAPTSSTTTLTSSTTDPPTTGSTTEDDTTDTTGGEPGGPARAVYMTQETGWLYHVDCGGPTPGPPTPVHPPTADWQVTAAQLSPTKRWISYGLAGPFAELEETEGHGQWFARVDGPTPGAPVKADLPDALRVLGAMFSSDETRVALVVDPPGQGYNQELYLCTFADGQCAPERWHPPLAGDGKVDASAAVFSPDGSRIAYAGDPQDTGASQIYLAGTEPGDANSLMALTMLAPPAFAGRPQFSADGNTLYFYISPAIGSPAGIFAVDLTSDPPGSPVPIWEPSGPAIYYQQFRDDGGALLVWAGPDQVLGGELSLITLTGTTASPPMPLHDVPEQVRYAEPFAWAPGGKWVVYTAINTDDPGTNDLFAVNVDGPVPAPPIELDAGVDSGDIFILPSFGPDDSRVFYPRVLDPTIDLFVAGLAIQAPPTPLHPPGFGVFAGPFAVAPDGARVALSGRRTGVDTTAMFLVELAALAPVDASPPLGPGGLFGRPVWTADSRRVFSAAEADGSPGAYYVDVADPGAPIRISSEEHAVDRVLVISPLP